MECLYCPIDRRYIKGNFRLDNDTQIDNERSIDNNDTSGATDPTQTEIVVDEIHPQNGINNSAITSSLQPLLTFPVTVQKMSKMDSTQIRSVQMFQCQLTWEYCLIRREEILHVYLI